jgi:hypothetical protein
MSELEKYANYPSRDKVGLDLIGGAIVFVFIGAITVVTLMIASWWLQ